MRCSDRSVQKLDPIGKEAGCRSGCVVDDSAHPGKFRTVCIRIDPLQTIDQIMKICRRQLSIGLPFHGARVWGQDASKQFPWRKTRKMS